jgi:hypothetical protein
MAFETGHASTLSACRCVLCLWGGGKNIASLTRVVVAKELLCAGVVGVVELLWEGVVAVYYCGREWRSL